MDAAGGGVEIRWMQRRLLLAALLLLLLAASARAQQQLECSIVVEPSSLGGAAGLASVVECSGDPGAAAGLTLLAPGASSFGHAVTFTLNGAALHLRARIGWGSHAPASMHV